MTALMSLVVLASFASGADYAPVDDSIPLSQNFDWLAYDNGTPNWIAYTGTYRGVWFNIQDFLPGTSYWEVGTAELWFYHHAELPWDTSNVMVEIWNGDANGPTGLLGQQMAIAFHYSPIYIVFNPVLQTGQNFWCVTNTEFSTGGWPSILSDGNAGSISHSFFSDDFIMWEPWIVLGGACNYFIRLNDLPIGTGLSRTTWGSLKATFQ